MKDTEKILAEIKKLKIYFPDFNFLLLTNAPICSKSKALLEKNNIKIKIKTEENLVQIASYYA